MSRKLEVEDVASGTEEARLRSSGSCVDSSLAKLCVWVER